MPENPIIPPPDVLLGNGRSVATNIPPPEELLSDSPYLPHIDAFDPVPENHTKTREIINNIPDLDNDKKEVLFDLAKKGAPKEVLSEAIGTLQGKNPYQEGGFKFYLDNNGIPHPLKNNEKPPAEFDIYSRWGSQKSADDDGFWTSLAKHTVNGALGAAEGVVNMVDMGQALVTGEESENLQGLRNAANYLKFKTATSEKGQIYKGEKVEDLFDPNKYDFSADNVRGQVLQGLESIIAFGLGSKGVGAVAKGAKAAKAGKVVDLARKEQIASGIAGATMISMGEMMEVADEGGMTGREKAAFVFPTSLAIGSLEAMFGPEGLLMNNLVRQEVKQLGKKAVSGIARDEAGRITKEGLEQLHREMVVGSTAIAKKYAGKVAKNVGEEALTESVQDFTKESAKYLYDKLKGEPAFGTNPFSLDALNNYVNSAIAGALGSVGPSVVLSKAATDKSIEQERSQNVFDIVQKGEDAIKSFKVNVTQTQKEGNITPEQAQDALTRVNAYKEYNDLVTSSEYELDDLTKKEVFEKTFQKQNLESQIEGVDPKTLHPLKQAEFLGKRKQADELQKDINEILLNAQVKQEPVVADKIKENQESPAPGSTPKKSAPISERLKAIREGYKDKLPKEDPRTYEDIPAHEYNDPKFNNRVKHKKTAEWLDRLPEKATFGKLIERHFSYKGKTNSTLGIELEDGKRVQFASSMLRAEGFRGHFREERMVAGERKDGEERFNREFPLGMPIGLKVMEIPALEEGSVPKKVIKAFRADNGKFIGWVKETTRGTSEYSPEQEQVLLDFEMMDEAPLDLFNKAVAPEGPKAPENNVPLTNQAQVLPDQENEENKPISNIPVEPVPSSKGPSGEGNKQPEEKDSPDSPDGEDNPEQEPAIKVIEGQANAAKRASDEEIQKGIDLANKIQGLSPDQQARDKGIKQDQQGNTYTRQENLNLTPGKPVTILFAKNDSEQGYYAVVEKDRVQPSHKSGAINHLHFIPEAQPRDRGALDKLKGEAQAKAVNLDPSQLGPNNIAYFGAPIINERGEVIQGNGRAEAIDFYYDSNQKDNLGYRAMILANAASLNLDPKQIEAMKNPVLVRVLPVSDDRAILLGNHTASELEDVKQKGADAKAAIGKVSPENIKRLTQIINSKADENSTLRAIIRDGDRPLFDLLVESGAIRADEYEKYFSGGPTPEGIEVAYGIIKELLFVGAEKSLAGKFEELPFPINQGIEKSIPAILSNPELKVRIHEAIEILYEHAQQKASFKDWIVQKDMFGDQKSPQEKYSKGSIRLAEKLIDAKQKEVAHTIQTIAGDMKGKDGDMFDPAVPPKSFDQAVEEPNLDYGTGIATFTIDEGTKTYKTEKGEEVPYQTVSESYSDPEIPGLFGPESESSGDDTGLDESEICFMERQINKTGVSLLGGAQIKSTDDVAYLFRHLESEVSENVFAVFIDAKGKHRVLYASTGSTTSSIVDHKQVYAAAKEFGAKQVYFVHNHPSGSLIASDADKSTYRKLKSMLAVGGVKMMPGVIINLDSGSYVTFDESTESVRDRPTSAEKEAEVAVERFDRQILYKPSSEKWQINNAAKVAEFLSIHKRGLIKKIGILILDRQNKINKYLLADPGLTEDQMLDLIMTNVGKSGENAVLVGNSDFSPERIKKLNQSLNKVGTTILDAIKVRSDNGIVNSFVSLSDEGLINDPASGYRVKSQYYFEHVPVSELINYTGGAKIDKSFDYDELEASIEDNGIRNPIVIKVNHLGKALIIDGVKRVLAASKLGVTKLPARIVDGDFTYSESQKAAPLPKLSSDEKANRIKEKLYTGNLKSIDGPYTRGFTAEEPETPYNKEGQVRGDEGGGAPGVVDEGNESGSGIKDSPGKAPAVRKVKSVFNKFRREVLGRDTATENKELSIIRDMLADKDLSAKERDELLDYREQIEQEKELDREAYEQYREEVKELRKFRTEEDLSGYSLDNLIEIYNTARTYEGVLDQALYDDIRSRIGEYLNEKRLTELRTKAKDIFSKKEGEVHSKDFTWIEKWVKALGDVSHKFPPLQELSKEFDEAYLKMITEATELKQQLEKKGKAVIREKNKKLGIIELAKQLVMSDSADYFSFVEQNGKLRTSTAGLTQAQKEYLELYTKIANTRQSLNKSTDDLLIKVDKGFQETWRNDGFMAAVSVWMGNNSEAEVSYTINGKKQSKPYTEAASDILKSNIGNVSKFVKLAQASYAAKKQSKDPKYHLKNGILTSRLSQDKKGWSKDHYRAAMSMIDDTTHIKHMNRIVPMVDSIEFFYKRMGIEEGKDFSNTLKFIEEWKAGHIYQESGVTNPVLDASLRTMRTFTSKVIMAFNVGANLMNAFIGNYNTWRQEGASHLVRGQVRFFGGYKRAALGLVSKKALDLINKYHVVNIDYDSNPKASVMKLFDKLAFLGLRSGEFQIQGSQFLGYLTKEEWRSIHYNSKDELVVPQEVESRIITYKNNVSDVQGKYSEKDRRNFMRYEFGKSLSQFKLWIFDAWRIRFGEEVITKDNKLFRGSFNYTTRAAIQELKADWSKHNIATAWKNEQTRKNLAGAMVIASFMIAIYQDDDDKKKKAGTLENALSQLLFVFDPHSLKYMIDSPVASFGTVSKFIDALDALIREDEKVFKKRAKKLIPYAKVVDLISEEKK